MMLDQVAEGGAEVMVATHNQASIQAAVAGMAARGVGPPPSCGVFFCQLLGMADHLTFTLGLNGYRVRLKETSYCTCPSAWLDCFGFGCVSRFRPSHVSLDANLKGAFARWKSAKVLDNS